VPESNRYLHNQRLGRIVDLDAERLHKRFLYYLFNTREVRAQSSGSASGTKVRHTAPERIGRVEVNLPPLDEQRRIAEVLTAYDDLMENNRRRMALLEEAARQLYAEWFVRLRYPGHARTRRADALPKGWTRRPLGEVAEVNRETLGSSFQGELEYVDISAVTPGRIGETTRYDFADAPSRARRVVRHGDIIWSCVRPNRRSHAVIWNPEPNLIVSTGFAVLTPKTLLTSYLYQATTTDAFVRNLENRARGAAYPAVVARDFEDSVIVVPPAPLVSAFNDFAEPLLAQLKTLTFQTQKLRAARDLLLPRLISGEITL
jgi:type I restriction enzyme S subunit